MKKYINFLNKLHFYRNSHMLWFIIPRHKFMETTIFLYLKYGMISFIHYKDDSIYVYPGADLRIKLLNKYRKSNPFFVRVRILKTINRVNFSCIIMNDIGFITHKRALDLNKGGILFSYIMLF